MLTSTEFGALYYQLEGWSLDKGRFHYDRDLADRVLLLDGWLPYEDKSFEGGVRWSRGILHASETTRPHPINDLNAASALVPFKHSYRLQMVEGIAKAWIWQGPLDPLGDFPVNAAQGNGRREAVALCAAFVKWKWTHRGEVD